MNMKINLRSSFVQSIFILLFLVLLGGGAELHRQYDERKKAKAAAARIAPYMAIVVELDNMDNSSKKWYDLQTLVNELSAGLKEKKVTSAELGKDSYYYPEVGSWVSIYRRKINVLRGQEAYAELTELCNKPGKKSAEEIARAQSLGVVINEINMPAAELGTHYGFINVDRKDVAALIKRVKNPSLPPVEIRGFNFTDGSGVE